MLSGLHLLDTSTDELTELDNVKALMPSSEEPTYVASDNPESEVLASSTAGSE